MAARWPNRTQDLSLCSVESGHYRTCCLLRGHERSCVLTLSSICRNSQPDNKAHVRLIVLFFFFLQRMFLFFPFFFFFFWKRHSPGRVTYFTFLCLWSLLCRGSWRAIIITACRDEKVWSGACLSYLRGSVWRSELLQWKDSKVNKSASWFIV